MAANNVQAAVLTEGLMYQQGTTAVLQLSIPASQPAGLLPNSDVAFYPFGMQNAPVNVVPSTEVWRLQDIVTYSAVTPDIYIGLNASGSVQPLNVDLNTVVIQGSSSRMYPISPYIDMVANTTFNFTAYLSADNGTTAQTINVSIKMERIPLNVYLASVNKAPANSGISHWFNL